MIESLYKEIEAFKPTCVQEIQDKKVMLEYIAMFDSITTRANRFAHMTSSPWIVNHDFSKVLMIYHTIYNSWSWCGGHLDGDSKLLHVALREGCEETGVSTLHPCSEDILAIDILPVPPHTKHGEFVSAHVHLNVTFLCIADEKAPLYVKPDENSDVRWIAVEEINDFVSEEDMKVVYAKLIEKAKKYV